MPEVRLLADAAGRYEVKKGELFVCTDEEFARWFPAGVVGLGDGESAGASEEPTVEEVQAETEAQAERPQRAQSRPRRRAAG